MILKLGMQNRGLKLYKVYINGGPGLTVPILRQDQNNVTKLLSGKN